MPISTEPQTPSPETSSQETMSQETMFQNPFVQEINQQDELLYPFQQDIINDQNWVEEAYEWREQENERLAQEEIKQKQREEALLAEQETSLYTDTDTGAIIYTPKTPKEEEQLLYHAENQYGLFVDNSIVLNSAKAFCRYGSHLLNKTLFEHQDPENFNVEEYAKNDGFSNEDIQQHFSGIEHKIDYDYIKEGILKERELNTYRIQHTDITNTLQGASFLMDLMALPAVTKPIRLGINSFLETISKNETALSIFNMCQTLTDKSVPSPLLKSIINGAFIGTSFGYLDYTSHYELPSEIIANYAYTGAILGGASRILPKIFSIVKNSVSREKISYNKDAVFHHLDKTVQYPEIYETSFNLGDDVSSGNSKLNWIEKGFSSLDRLKVFRTPSSVIEHSPSQSLKRLAQELYDSVIPQEHLENPKAYLQTAELKAKVLLKPFDTEFGKIFKYCNQNKNEIKNLTGMTPGQLCDRIIQERALPNEALTLPESTQQKFQKLIEVMNSTEDKIAKLALEVNYPNIISRPVLTPEALTILRKKTQNGEPITFKDYQDLLDLDLIKRDAVYIGKRYWDAEAIISNNNFRQIFDTIKFSEGLIKFNEINKNALAQCEIKSQNLVKAIYQNTELKLKIFERKLINERKFFQDLIHDLSSRDLSSKQVISQIDKYLKTSQTKLKQSKQDIIKGQQETFSQLKKFLKTQLKELRENIRNNVSRDGVSRDGVSKDNVLKKATYDSDTQNKIKQHLKELDDFLSDDLKQRQGDRDYYKRELLDELAPDEETVFKKYIDQFNSFMDNSPELEKKAQFKLNAILNPNIPIGDSSNAIKARTILVSPRETSQWHKTNTVSSYINEITQRTRKIVFFEKLNKVAREFDPELKTPIEDIDQFIEQIVKPELDRKLSSMLDLSASDNTTPLLKQYQQYNKQVNDLINNAKMMASVFDGSLQQHQYSTNASQILFGIKKWMYGMVLGMTPLSSLPDGANLILHGGLKRYTNNMFNKEFQVVVDDTVKTFSKKDMKEILSNCAYGLDKTLREHLLRDSSELFQLNITPRNNWIKNFVSSGDKFAQITYKWSLLEAMDNAHIKNAQRTVLQDLLSHPWRTGNSKKEIVKMMEDRVFSDEVNAYMYNQISTLVNKPRAKNITSYSYSPIGNLFYTFQSWVTAHTENFVKPFLSTGYGHKIESLCWITAMVGLSTYLKSIANGKSLNLSVEEDREIFYKRMYSNGLDEIIGVYALANTVAESAYKIATRRNTNVVNEIISQRLPAINWGNKVLTSAIRSLYDISAISDLLKSATPNWWWAKTILNNSEAYYNQ